MDRLEVAGCIASGKTTLVKAISGYAAIGVYEDHRINPFWQAFYTDPTACAFETEVTFLLQHYHFLKLAEAGKGRPIIMDHSFELDMAYAELGLKGRRKDIFERIYHEIHDEIGPPEAIVFVKCSAQEAHRRIRDRGRDFEKNISLEFLDHLQRELEHRIAEVSRRVRVVTVDSEETDFRQSQGWPDRLAMKLGIH